MKITAMEEYGLRCMMQLASRDSDDPMTVSYVADNEGLSYEYAGKLLNLLRRSGLVDSVRGRNGGFMLARNADEISLADILRVFSDDLFDTEYCQRYSGNADTCVHLSSCSLRPVWWTLSTMIHGTLERLTLMDLTHTERQVLRELRPHLDALPLHPQTLTHTGGSESEEVHQIGSSR